MRFMLLAVLKFLLSLSVLKPNEQSVGVEHVAVAATASVGAGSCWLVRC